MDVAMLPPAEAGAKIRARPPAVGWPWRPRWTTGRRCGGDSRRDRTGAGRFTEIARLADPDPWRNRLRAVPQISASGNASARGPRQVGTDRRTARGEPHLLGVTLLDSGDPTGAKPILREAVRRYPVTSGSTTACRAAWNGRAREEAIRLHRRAIAPARRHELAHPLEQKGETDRPSPSSRIWRDSGRKEGGTSAAWARLLKDQGRTAEARDVLDEAISILGGGRARARPARHPHESRFCPLWQGELNRGDRRIPRGAAAQARPRRGPLQPRPRAVRRGSGTRRSPNTARRCAQARLRRGPQQPRRRS